MKAGRWFELPALRALLALALSLVLVQPVRAESEMIWGYALAGQPDGYDWVGTPTSVEGDSLCSASARIWLKEFGDSGIDRFRVKFELRGPNDPGLPFLSYQETDWIYGPRFADDYLDHWSFFWVRFSFFIGNTYKIRAVMIGERPSFWQFDERIEAALEPDVGCDGGGTIVTP